MKIVQIETPMSNAAYCRSGGKGEEKSKGISTEWRLLKVFVLFCSWNGSAVLKGFTANFRVPSPSWGSFRGLGWLGKPL
jgi:hypothetical protein